MGWEYSDTDCKYANVCSLSPRCTAKSNKEVDCYRKDTRSFLQKIFSPINYYSDLKNEYSKKCE